MAVPDASFAASIIGASLRLPPRRLVDAVLHLRAEMPDQALDRPCRRIAERTDGVAFDLLGDLEQRVDLAVMGVAGAMRSITRHHPAGAFAARRALAAALMLVEVAEARRSRG